MAKTKRQLRTKPRRMETVSLADIPDLLKQCDALTAKLRFYDELAGDLIRLVGDVMTVCKGEGIMLGAIPSRRTAAERRLNVLRGQLEMFE